MTYRIIFSYTNYLCDGTSQFTDSLRIQTMTDNESDNPVIVLYDWLSDKEHLLVGKNSIICYDDVGNIKTVYSGIHFAD